MTLDEKGLDELKAKHEAAFRAPWTYSRWEVECSACEGGSETHESGECTNPDCDGTHAPVVAVESPEEYPNGQLVAQISVPGLLQFADKNGASIVALHNAFPELEALARFGLKAAAFMREHGYSLGGVCDGSDPDCELRRCREYRALLESARALEGKSK